jgi:hypothetical protein
MGAAMNEQLEQFQAIPMSWRGATAAYPLVRLHDASVTLGKWLRFVRRHCGPAHQRAGLIAIRDCRGIVHALFSYRVDFDLHNRKRLCVANLIVAHIPGSKIEEAVATSTRNISNELGCYTISAEQPFRPVAPWKPCATAEAPTRRIGLNSRLH